MASMKNYYFGSMDEYIQTGYAPTDRASCKACKLGIGKSAVRMGYIMDSDHFSGKNWYHLACFTLRPLFKDLNPEEQIYKIEELDKEDREGVVEHVAREVERLKSGIKLKRKGKSKKMATQSKEEDEKEEETEVPVAPVEKAKSERSLRSRSRSQSKPAKKSLGKRSASKPKGSAKKAKKVKKTSGLTAEQKAQFKEYLDQFMPLTINELKEILSKNGQTKTGLKKDLAIRCADGKLLGRIPMCPSCGGGRPKFDQDTGIYKCRGYMDDDEFQNCNKVYTMAELPRQPWVE